MNNGVNLDQSDPEVIELFDQSFAAIPNPKTINFDLTNLDIIKPSHETLVLFDTAFDEIRPSNLSKTKNKKKLISSDQREIESRKLESHAKATALIVEVEEYKVEKKSKARKKKLKEKKELEMLVIEPSIIEKVKSSLIDTLSTLVLTFTITGLLAFLKSPERVKYLFEIAKIPFIEWVHILSIAIAILPLTGIALHFIQLMIRNETLGMDTQSIKIVSLDGGIPSTGQKFIRASLIPFSILFGGPILSIFKGRSMADVAANTRLRKYLENS